jgi:LysR family transcriptional regulator for metE and metH
VKRIESPSPGPAWQRPQLEVRDLELVLALATAGTTAAAASALHITQSAISRALAQAEKRVGARLFQRSGRGVAPTVAGERLIAGAAAVLARLSELEQAVASPAVTPTRVRLVCECYTAYRWLPSAIASLRQRLPGVEIELAVEHTGAPIEALVRDDIDVALLTTGSLPSSERGTLMERPLFSDEIVFIVSASHPLAEERALDRDDLRAYPLITSNTPPAEANWFLTSVFGRRRPKLKYLRLPLTEAIIDAARAGMGIAVLSEWMSSSYLGGGDLLVKRLASGALRRPWRIAYRREVAASAERLIAALAGSAPNLYTARAG